MVIAHPDIAFVTDDSASNSLGRVYCLWLLAEKLGLSSVTVAATGSRIWAPLDGTEFSKTILGRGSVHGPLSQPGMIVCVKPLPKSVQSALYWSRAAKVPLILDIDDPDIEAGLSEGDALKRVAKSILRPRNTRWFVRASRLAREVPVIVSNPYLHARYGGTMIPHVRTGMPFARDPDAERPTIAFVGTNRPHKGVELLRSAVADSQAYGYRLVITDSQPKDARVWEDWVGQCSLKEGLNLVAKADVVVIPSEDTAFSRGQLPVKLVDAMLLGRAVIASDLPAVRWAVRDAGRLFQAGDAASLRQALADLSGAAARVDAGQRARRRAGELFSVETNAPKFAAVLEGAR